MRARLVGVVVAASMLAGCGLLDGGAAKQMTQAEAALDAGKYAEAAITLRNVVQKEAGNAGAQLLLARAHYMRGDAAAADAVLADAEEAGGDAAAIGELRARLALSRGQFKELLQALDSGRYALTSPATQLYRARAEQGLGMPVEALTIFNALLESQPDSADLHLYVAECHATLGRPQQALEQVEKALSLQADLANAWRLRAVLQSGNAEEAQAAMQKAMDLAPGQLTIPEQFALIAPQFQRAANRLDVDAASTLQQKLLGLAAEAPLTLWASGEVQLIRGNTAEASTVLQRLVQSAPDFTPARPALIGALLAAGNFELARQESTALVGNAPNDQRPKAAQQAIKQAADAVDGSEQEILQGVAAALMLEQTPAARWMLERGTQAHPESEAIALLTIQQQLAAGQTAQALERVRALAARLPRSSGAHMLLANVLASSGDSPRAQQTLEALWRESRTQSVALALAQSRLRTGQGDPLQPLRQWLASHPDDLLVRTGLASAAMEAGQNDTALAEYERIVAAAPTNAVALNNLAWLYSRRGDRRALVTARRAYEAASSAQIADTYGWLLMQSGDIKAALPLLEKAAQGALGSPEIRYHYAAALVRSGGQDGLDMARRWLADLLSDPSATEWRADAERLLAQVSRP